MPEKVLIIGEHQDRIIVVDAVQTAACVHYFLHRRKVRAPQGRVLCNAERGRPQGKCHRKHTACGHRPPVRVKRRGKSPPASMMTLKRGKPHLEQDQIGGLVSKFEILKDGPSDAPGYGRWRRRATGVQEEWSLLSEGRPSGENRTRLTDCFDLFFSTKEDKTWI